MPKGSGEKILIVEHDIDVRDVALHLLEGLSYKVFEAGDGRAALKILAELDASGDGADLVFSDIVMPLGMNGIDLSLTMWLVTQIRL